MNFYNNEINKLNFEIIFNKFLNTNIVGKSLIDPLVADPTGYTTHIAA